MKFLLALVVAAFIAMFAVSAYQDVDVIAAGQIVMSAVVDSVTHVWTAAVEALNSAKGVE